MDFHVGFAALSGFFVLCSFAVYVRDMFVGSTRPNLISYVLWFLLLGIAVVAQFSSGASWSIVMPTMGLACSAAIVTLILFGYGYKRYYFLDGICLVLGLIAITAWYLTNEPRFAVVISVTASFIAAIPTIVKTYRDPSSEHLGAWAVNFLAGLFSLLSTRIADVANLAYPVYILIESGLITMLAWYGQRLMRR
jgi:uncharacterized membrane protein YfhO